MIYEFPENFSMEEDMLVQSVIYKFLKNESFSRIKLSDPSLKQFVLSVCSS